MKVKELIEKLKKCNPEATVFTNQWQEMDVNDVIVAKAKDDGETANATQGLDEVIYIGDDFDELHYELEEDGFTVQKIE